MWYFKINRIVIVITILALFVGCNKKERTCTFYHWEQTLDLKTDETQLLQDFNANELYVRIFDIDFKDKSKAPAFLSSLHVKNQLPENISVIPCIFITNRSFKNIDFAAVDSLAHRTAAHINYIENTQDIAFGDEIQIDCDWTPSTRVHYFAYLKQLKKYLPQFGTISATIRLHQFKYPEKTGIPPVDKGSLMVYNMGDFEDSEASNAIYSNDILKQYLKVKAPYPLHLDIAMPTFSWALVFRFGKAVKIIHHPDIENLNSAKEHFTKLSQNKYKINKNGYWQGLYLYKGDVLRVDRIDAKEIEEGLKLIRNNEYLNPDKVIYYHLFNNIKQLYTDEDFKSFNAVIN
ncbi:hypothetical protein [Marinifilum flexuosum]|uniref:Lipoprotein n=1 Tax=Marinifilum flexuosum TaxID=1117708 RepID=A0A419WT24_9BACT|nr:hypothetical protein [Marinifilum flexuosum]RKD98597.1 hypothetical protein BXY64_3456 [Marinifilum flexuosum]